MSEKVEETHVSLEEKTETDSGAMEQTGPSEEHAGDDTPPGYHKVSHNTEQAPEDDNSCGVVLQVFSIIFIILFFPFSLLCCLKMVQEYERAVIFRLGRILHGGAKGPGLFFVYPCTDDIIKVDLRTKAVDIHPQDILTKDHVTVTVDAVMYYKIVDPVASVTKIENVGTSTRMLGATTLRNILGTYKMTELLAAREEINLKMKEQLDNATDPWGVDVERVELTDVSLPADMQRAMAAEAEATREARAKVIAAEGEQKASRALREAAEVIMECPAAMQLRYLQTLNTISAEKNSTIVFPLPMEFMQAFRGGGPMMPVTSQPAPSYPTASCPVEKE